MGKRGKVRLLRTFIHLGISFNPGVSFESIIYRWKAISGLLLMDILRTWFYIENVVGNTFEKQGGGFVEIAASETQLITYEDIKLHKKW